VGVDLFFVLSGFLVSGLLFQEYRERGTVSPGRFLIRRGFKIYPGFYCFLLFLTAVSLLRVSRLTDFNWWKFLVESLFVQNYFRGMFVHTWSLAVEEHFYIALALVLYLLSHTRILHRRTVFLSLGFGTILLVFSMRVVNALQSPTESAWGDQFVLGRQYCATHLRLDGLLFGVMLSYLYHFEHSRTIQFCRRWRAVMIPVGLLIVVLTPWLGTEQVSLYPSDNFWLGTVGFTLLYVGWGGVLMGVIALPASAWNNPLARIVSWIGFYSYSTYLWHVFVVGLFLRGVHGLHLAAYPHVSMVGYTISAVFAGYLAAKAVEMPMLALRDRLFPRRA
jgi:peptidoglycan/LPS O-acetylase OafA/YrhL